MPKHLQFSAGSLIYFQGDPADRVFIVQKGTVNLVYQNIETGEDVRDAVQVGEFFGVKSALGRFKREENAVAIQNSTLMAFTVAEFEALATANTRIILKMLKVFSNQLRRVHKQVSSMMSMKEHKNPEDGLFSMGEHYVKTRNFKYARHVFSRYLSYYPEGDNASQAAFHLKSIDEIMGQAGGQK